MATIKPAANRFLVEVLPRTDALYGSKPSKLILPESQEEPFSMLYRVLAVGEFIEKEGRVKVGDIVFRSQLQSGAVVLFDNKTYFLLSEGDIIGFLVSESNA